MNVKFVRGHQEVYTSRVVRGARIRHKKEYYTELGDIKNEINICDQKNRITGTQVASLMVRNAK